ncbi:MAG: class I SAM-dependent rRNA methyltransferase [Erysipelotrichaceae bacterium]|nr:class I SAM-dependent rRNA methyltransferase [Erysipelotrichaceae bacterium]
MKTARLYPQITVSKKGEKWLDSGHVWLYESDITDCPDQLENGRLVDVIGPKGKYLGTGFYSSLSKIRVRIFSKDASLSYDRSFWKRRLEHAYEYRKSVMGSDVVCCRLIFGESDQFPGWTVDRFDDILVSQITTVGIEKMKDQLFELLVEVLEENGQKISGIYERNDVAVRKLEGMDQYTGYYQLKDRKIPDHTETVITENGVRYYVDFADGQKTGFFLDQKFNRRLCAALAADKKILDCFTHTGSFALNCALNGARKVTAVDISETALKQAQRNADLNGLTNIEFVCDDAFEYLKKVNKKEFDFIILDPPAFTKSRSTVKNAYNGYLEINQTAMKLLGRGGYLATCSCSHFMPHEMFEKMLKEAAFRAAVNLKQISVSQQGKDHPILWSVPETDYLKFYIFQII